MKKVYLIIPVAIFGFFLFFNPVANSADGYVVSGEITYDDYESGNILTAVFVDGGYQNMASNISVISYPGEYEVVLDIGVTGDLFIISFNDLNGDDSPGDDEPMYTGSITVDEDVSGFDMELTISGDGFDPEEEEEEDEETTHTAGNYTVSGEVISEYWISGNINVHIYNGEPGNGGVILGSDTLTSGPGEYEIDVDLANDGTLYIFSYCDSNSNNEYDEGTEDVFMDQISSTASSILMDFTLVLGGGEEDETLYNIFGEVTYGDWTTGQINVEIYNIGEYPDGDDVADDKLDEGPGEYEIEIPEDISLPTSFELVAYVDVNDNDIADEGEPAHFSGSFTMSQEDYEYDFEIDSTIVGDGDYIIMTPASAGGPNVRAVDYEGNQIESFFAYQEDLRGSFYTLFADIDGDKENEIIAYPGMGFGPNIRAFESDGELIDWFMAYTSDFRGGVNVVACDFDGDNDYEIAVAPYSEGGPNIRIYDLTDEGFELVDWFMAYDRIFYGGVNLACNDILGDNTDELVVATRNNGGPNVRVYDYTNDSFSLVDYFFPFQAKFHGGVNISTGNIDGDEYFDIIVAPNNHGGPNVRVYEYDSENGEFDLLGWFMAYDESFRGQMNIAVGNIYGDEADEIVIAPKTEGGPNVRVYGYDSNSELSLIDWFMAYDEDFRGGINLTTVNVDGADKDEIVIAPYRGAPNVRSYQYDEDNEAFDLLDWFWGFPQAFAGGVNFAK